MAEQQQRNAGDKPHWQKPRSDSFKGKHGGGGEQGARRPAAPYNPNLARFKRQNPGNGPHGFGGTFKKGEKGGHRPLREGEDIPLAERGLQRHGGAAAAAAPKAKASATAVAGMSATAIKSKIRDLTRLLKKPVSRHALAAPFVCAPELMVIRLCSALLSLHCFFFALLSPPPVWFLSRRIWTPSSSSTRSAT